LAAWERTMKTEGGVFEPETIDLLRQCLEEAWTELGPAGQARVSKTMLAERILKAAATGERDPVRLRTAALVTIVDAA
jgi:hypothetical protein